MNGQKKKSSEPPVLSRILERAVRLPLRSTTKMGVIDELIDILLDLDLITDKEEVFNDVMAREQEKSTGLEKGVAVPHAKTNGVQNLHLAVGISPRGIDFGAFDNQVSRIFFLILCPPDQPNQHIKALQEIAFLVSDEHFRTALLNAVDPAGVIKVLQDYLRKAS